MKNSLGNIYPSQGDYNQSVKGGGNGDYKLIVLVSTQYKYFSELSLLFI